MIDVKTLRADPEKMKRIIKSGRGNIEKADVDAWLELDKRRVLLIGRRDEVNQRRNELSDLGKSGDLEKVKEEGRYLKEELRKIELELDEVTERWQEILDWMPNFPVDMPEGNGELDNVVIKQWVPDRGYISEAVGKKVRDNTEIFMPKSPDYSKHHMDLFEKLGLVDNSQGARASGSRFTYIIGDLAILQYALQQFFFGELIKRGFKHIISPLLVKERVLYGTSHFPEGREQVYAIDTKNVEDATQLYLVGSTEPSNFAYFMDRLLDEKDLPTKIFAYAPAFRSEAGSWGRDVRGIKRMHQFDKIEMNAVTTKDQSNAVFDEFLSINEWVLQSLKLPYRLVQKCTGDAGYLASARQVDPEVWLPGQNEFMEVMTDTNTTDYQARRLNIRYRSKDGKMEYAHTVNDTGIAMGRMLIAIACNYQQADGTILVPEVLQKYTGFNVLKK